MNATLLYLAEQALSIASDRAGIPKENLTEECELMAQACHLNRQQTDDLFTAAGQLLFQRLQRGF